jgi:hypothetical protein
MEVRFARKNGCFETNFPRGLSVAEVRFVILSFLRIFLFLARPTDHYLRNV